MQVGVVIYNPKKLRNNMNFLLSYIDSFKCILLVQRLCSGTVQGAGDPMMNRRDIISTLRDLVFGGGIKGWGRVDLEQVLYDTKPDKIQVYENLKQDYENIRAENRRNEQELSGRSWELRCKERRTSQSRRSA